MERILKKLPAKSFPTAARTFLETVQGNRDDITEKNFTKEEMAEIQKLVVERERLNDAMYHVDTDKPELRAIFRRGREMHRPYNDRVTYADYDGHIVKGVSPAPSRGFRTLATPRGNVLSTLGQFRYKPTSEVVENRRQPTGHEVTDTYDFSKVNRDKGAVAVDGRLENGIYGQIREYAGEALSDKSDTYKGRKVKVQVPKDTGGEPKYKKGGPVRRGYGKARGG